MPDNDHVVFDYHEHTHYLDDGTRLDRPLLKHDHQHDHYPRHTHDVNGSICYYFHSPGNNVALYHLPGGAGLIGESGYDITHRTPRSA